jgi:transposase
MKKAALWSPAPNQEVLGIEWKEEGWIVSVTGYGGATCPACRTRSGSRHSSNLRSLRDLPVQGTPVTVRARLTRWRCRNDHCEQRIFSERLPYLASPYARRTARLAGIVRLVGHAAGGRPAERLMRRLGMPVDRTTILRMVKRSDQTQADPSFVRVAGIDDWAWKKGMSYGTVIVDLERHQVVDLLADRSSVSTAEWLLKHPEVEVVCRDRAGLYADGARQGAPQARQVADRFHLLQNFRETVERQLGRFEAPIRGTAALARPDADGAERPGVLNSRGCSEAAEQQESTRRGRNAATRQALFDHIRALFEAGGTVREIALELGLGRRRVERWVRLVAVPERNTMAPKVCTPAYFGALLARRWAEGITTVRLLLAEIRQHGYTGSYGHLARFLAPRLNAATPLDRVWAETNHEAQAPLRLPALDPMTGRQISPLSAAALCVKPRGQMTDRQIVNVDALKAASAEFTTMRQLAMRFRGLLRGGTVEKLDAWLGDARQCGIFGMQRFARTLRQDIGAVRNAMLEPWSNGQAEGQINRLKTLKRAMYGRAGIDLLRARMMPLHEPA